MTVTHDRQLPGYQHLVSLFPLASCLLAGQQSLPTIIKHWSLHRFAGILADTRSLSVLVHLRLENGFEAVWDGYLVRESALTPASVIMSHFSAACGGEKRRLAGTRSVGTGKRVLFCRKNH